MRHKIRLKNYTIPYNLVCGVFALCCVSLGHAQPSSPFNRVNGEASSYPATIRINTNGGTTPFNNSLLGSNVDINTRELGGFQGQGPLEPNASVSSQGFKSPVLQTFLDQSANDPVVIRFPQGVWANVYNWQDFTINGETFPEDSRSARDPITNDNANGRMISRFTESSSSSLRLGYPALRGIFSRAQERELPLELLTVLNIIEDDEISSRDRLEAMKNDGFEVKDVELGNEFFFPSQRSNTIDTEEAWVERAQKVVKMLREKDPNLRFAIPITWRANPAQVSGASRSGQIAYNNNIVGDQSFFDAIVVHRYVDIGVRDPMEREAEQNRVRGELRAEGATTEEIRDAVDGVERFKAASELTDNDLVSAFTASSTIAESIDFCKRQVNPDKRRVWLTEWGVTGAREQGIGASFLGMADSYIDLLKRDDMERINWFSTFGLNAQYGFVDNNATRAMPTGFGRVYQTFRNALRDNALYNDVEITAPQLERAGVNQQINALNALAIRVGDSTKLLLVNKANTAAEIRLSVNGGPLETGLNFVRTGINFPSLKTEDVRDVGNNNIERNRSFISIPAFSVVEVALVLDNGTTSKSIDDAKALNEIDNALSVSPNPSDDKIYTINTDAKWNVYTIQGEDVLAGEGSTVDLSNISSGVYVLRCNGKTAKIVVN